MAAVDFDKFRKMAARLASPHDGERLAAINLLNNMLATAGTSWVEFIDALVIADQASREAVRENQLLREQVAELEAQAPDWTAVTAPATRASDTAEWLIQLDHQGKVWFSAWEADFIQSVRRWRGPPSPKQSSVLQGVVDRVRRQTGMTPPP